MFNNCVWIYDVHSETRVCVPENARQRFRVTPAFHRVRGESVPQIVEPNQRQFSIF